MSDSPFIQLARTEVLVSELETREKRAPMLDEHKARLAKLAGLGRSSVQGALSGASENGKQPMAIDLAQEVLKLSDITREALLSTLKTRFEKHPERHKIVKWEKVKKSDRENPKLLKRILKKAKIAEWKKVRKALSLEKNEKALWSIQRLEETGGEPDVFRVDKDGFEIGDCSTESPDVRRGIDYVNAAFLADQWCAGLVEAGLMEMEQYEHLYLSGPIDNFTQSLLSTSSEMRQSGGALCGFVHPTSGLCFIPGDALDQREDRGFRCAIRVEWAKGEEGVSFWNKLITWARAMKIVSLWRKLFK